jgi:hypothetical protein
MVDNSVPLAPVGERNWVSVLVGDPPRPLPDEEAARFFVHSYLTIRTTVGVLGILTPVMLFIGEVMLHGWGTPLRGSLSSYYHSPMQDFFVATLSIVAFLLLTYMSGQPRTRDFWYSLGAGVFLIGVIFFPTGRGSGPPLCGSSAASLPGCSPVENAWGETTVAHLHAACAIAFILFLALMSFLFARDEAEVQGNLRMHHAQSAFGVAILLFGVWAIIGFDLGPVARLWLGEVGAVWSFALSWLFKGAKIEEILHGQPLRRHDIRQTS